MKTFRHTYSGTVLTEEEAKNAALLAIAKTLLKEGYIKDVTRPSFDGVSFEIKICDQGCDK